MNEILKNCKTTNSLTWAKKAELKILPDLLPWYVIGDLIDPALADTYTDAITKALFDRELKVFVPPWSEETKQANIALYGLAAITPQIHKDEFKRWWLVSNGEWPVNGLLANWWIDEQSNTATQADNKPLTSIKTNVFSSPPKKKDSWFDAIEEATLTLFNQLGKLPTGVQVWVQLSTEPPHGYGIEPGLHRGENCLNMPGITPLPKSGFLKRWGRYTDK